MNEETTLTADDTIDDATARSYVMEVFQMGREAERRSIVDWLRLISLGAAMFTDTDPEGRKWALAGDWADRINSGEHLK